MSTGDLVRSCVGAIKGSVYWDVAFICIWGYRWFQNDCKTRRAHANQTDYR
ncbi:hypothetical protein B0J17DRAFT_710840, partial [Rhizoctonia solani]